MSICHEFATARATSHLFASIRATDLPRPWQKWWDRLICLLGKKGQGKMIALGCISVHSFAGQSRL